MSTPIKHLKRTSSVSGNLSRDQCSSSASPRSPFLGTTPRSGRKCKAIETPPPKDGYMYISDFFDEESKKQPKIQLPVNDPPGFDILNIMKLSKLDNRTKSTVLSSKVSDTPKSKRRNCSSTSQVQDKPTVTPGNQEETSKMEREIFDPSHIDVPDDDPRWYWHTPPKILTPNQARLIQKGKDLKKKREQEEKDKLNPPAVKVVSTDDIIKQNIRPIPRPDILEGVVAHVDAHISNCNVFSVCNRELKGMGALVRKTFTQDVSYVIFREGKYATYQRAMKLGAHLVDIHWIEACKIENKIVDYEKCPAKDLEKYKYGPPKRAPRTPLSEDQKALLRRGRQRKKEIEAIERREKELEEERKKLDEELKMLDERIKAREKEKAEKQLNLLNQSTSQLCIETENERQYSSCDEALSPKVICVAVESKVPGVGETVSTDICERYSIRSKFRNRPRESPCTDKKTSNSKRKRKVAKNLSDKLFTQAHTVPQNKTASNKVEESHTNKNSELDSSIELVDLTVDLHNSMEQFITKNEDDDNPKVDSSSVSYLSMTGMNIKQQEIVKAAVKSLGGFQILTDVPSHATHVVCGKSKMTFNGLKAVLNGSWILGFRWVQESMKKGVWLSEKEYILEEVQEAMKVTKGDNRVESQGDPWMRCSLLSKCGSIYVHPEAAHAAELKELISLAGGQIAFNGMSASIVVADKKLNHRCHNIVSPTWLKDCVTNYSVLALEPYII